MSKMKYFFNLQKYACKNGFNRKPHQLGLKGPPTKDFGVKVKIPANA